MAKIYSSRPQYLLEPANTEEFFNRLVDEIEKLPGAVDLGVIKSLGFEQLREAIERAAVLPNPRITP